jgi:hypothetical protein
MQPIRSIESLSVLDAPVRRRRNRSTVGWTRHTLGAIEAGRDGRLESRVPGPIRYRTTPVAGAVVLRPDFAGDRWADEGGSSDHEPAVAVAVALPR